MTYNYYKAETNPNALRLKESDCIYTYNAIHGHIITYCQITMPQNSDRPPSFSFMITLELGIWTCKTEPILKLKA
jgi:hypothetical protein